MSTRTELLPCPFCGGEAQIDGGVGAECSKCLAVGPGRHDEADTVAAWNHRAAPPQVDALLAEYAKLAGALQDCDDEFDGYAIRARLDACVQRLAAIARTTEGGSMSEEGRKLVKARDTWLASDEGERCADTASLYAHPSAAQYLRNRLESAFIAGWDAAIDAHTPDKEAL